MPITAVFEFRLPLDFAKCLFQWDGLEHLGWFAEGFDTADLKDAKALLDELSA